MSHFGTYRSKLIQLHYDHASQAVSLALIRLGMALDRAIRAGETALDHAFNPNQPRVPAGHPDPLRQRQRGEWRAMDRWG